jgi:hypothetical protein
MYLRLVLILLFSFLLTPVNAASFDCNKATTETEKAICADPELSALDDLIGLVWREQDLSNSLVAEQKAWLKQRDEPQPEDSEETNLEYLYYEYLHRIAKLMGQLDQGDVINIFRNNDYWEVDHTSSETGFIFSHKDFQFLFLPTQNNTNAVFTTYSKPGGPYCDRRSYSFSNETLLIQDRCNDWFYYYETYSYSDGYFFLSKATESIRRLPVYEGNLLSLSGDYENGITSVTQRVCTSPDDPLNCFLEPTEFTYSFNNQKRFILGGFSRDELPHKNRPVNFEKTKPEDYFKRFSQDKYIFKDDYSNPNLTDAVTSFISNIQTKNGQNSCGIVLSGYSKVASGYTAVFSSFSNLRDGFANDDPIEFNLNNYLSWFGYSDPIVSLSRVLTFLNSYSATENIVSLWFHKLDEDTKRQLTLFSKYALEYRLETGNLLNACFDEFEKIEFWVPSSYKQKSGQKTKFLWKPINEYLDGFWDRRISDGTADQVKTIFELVANFKASN